MVLHLPLLVMGKSVNLTWKWSGVEVAASQRSFFIRYKVQQLHVTAAYDFDDGAKCCGIDVNAPVSSSRQAWDVKSSASNDRGPAQLAAQSFHHDCNRLEHTTSGLHSTGNGSYSGILLANYPGNPNV